MDVVQLTLEACALVFTPLPLILLFCGVLFGTLLGALPGLGSILALTVCLLMRRVKTPLGSAL